MNPLLRPRPSLPSLFDPERETRAGTDAGAASPAGRPAASATGAPQCHWDFCPNCSTRLVNQKCKYRCPRCFYFMSCSDFERSG